MTKIVENYVLLEQLRGTGSFGEIYRAKHIATEEIFAIRMLMFDKFLKSSSLQEVLINEVQILKKLDHSNIIRFQKLLKTSNHIYLIYEFCAGGSLHNALQSQDSYIEEEKALQLYTQIVDALRSIHKQNILHRNLTPKSVLFTDKGEIKLAGFGYSLCLTDEAANTNKQNNNGSAKFPIQPSFATINPIYLAPEVLQWARTHPEGVKNSAYSFASDVYSIGVLLYQMLYGELPYQIKDPDSLLTLKQASQVQFCDEVQVVSTSTKSLIREMLCAQPQQRISLEEIYDRCRFHPTKVERRLSNIFTRQEIYSPITTKNSDNFTNGSEYQLVPISPNSASSAALSNSTENNKNQLLQTTLLLNLNTLKTNGQIPSYQQFNDNNSIFKQDYSKEFRKINLLLMKERNKIIYTNNIVCAVLDLNLEYVSIHVVYLLLQRMHEKASQIQQLFVSKKSHANSGSKENITKMFPKYLQNQEVWKAYQSSEDYELMRIYLNKELTLIDSNIVYYSNFMLTLPSTNTYFDSNSSKTLINYTYSVLRRANTYLETDLRSEHAKKCLMHANNILDCVDLDRFFEQSIATCRPSLFEQPYFNIISQLDTEQLLLFVKEKIQLLNSNMI